MEQQFGCKFLPLYFNICVYCAAVGSRRRIVCMFMGMPSMCMYTHSQFYCVDYIHMSHVRDFFQIFSGGGHPTTAKKTKIRNLQF